MKKTAFTALLVCFAAWAFAGIDVPKAVKDKFASMYPNVKKVDWDKEGNNYEGEFEANGIETSVVFDANGSYLQTEVEIKPSALPANIFTYVSQNYKAYKLAEAAKITDAAGTVTYEAEVKKGKEEMDLIFDSSGNFLKKESEPAEEKDDKDKH